MDRLLKSKKNKSTVENIFESNLVKITRTSLFDRRFQVEIAHKPQMLSWESMDALNDYVRAFCSRAKGRVFTLLVDVSGLSGIPSLSIIKRQTDLIREGRQDPSMTKPIKVTILCPNNVPPFMFHVASYIIKAIRQGDETEFFLSRQEAETYAQLL